MRVSLPGPARATAADATPVDVGGVRLRMLLAGLAVEGGRPVSVDALADGLRGEHPLADAGDALQALVSRLRKGPARGGDGGVGRGGYRIAVAADDVDTHRFEELAGQGRRELAAGHADEVAATLGEALALWRGAALADVLEAPFARAAATRR
ncbi:BTAD domain-containing putative transcriptional regulator [Streptomyces sp. NPDC002855]|uniref:AfsR/SARP family transcriptional regulator n=1 Tax=Streptomyces sp. NPDC002855 TaxID=3154437 RepID=UPI00332A5032